MIFRYKPEHHRETYRPNPRKPLTPRQSSKTRRRAIWSKRGGPASRTLSRRSGATARAGHSKPGGARSLETNATWPAPPTRYSSLTTQPKNMLRNQPYRTTRKPMKHTLGTAAKATGKAKSTILRAIKSGVISASQTTSGSYQIDPAELHRAFPSVSAHLTLPNDTQPIEERATSLRFQVETLTAERERERSQMQATIDDLRERLDRSEARVAALLPRPPRRLWPW